jgi:hypothetical protein
MAIPISYNIRNLKLRKGLTIMTALGIALTVTTAVFLMALLAGLKKAFMSSGDPVNVLVMRTGSVAELSGGFDASLFPTLKTLPGIAKDGQGEPLASGEWVVVVVLPRKDGTGEVNVSVRGLMPAGLTLRPGAKLVEGRWLGSPFTIVFPAPTSATISILPKDNGKSLASSILAALLMIRNSGATSIRSPRISTARGPLRLFICEPPTRLQPMRSNTASPTISG